MQNINQKLLKNVATKHKSELMIEEWEIIKNVLIVDWPLSDGIKISEKKKKIEN